MKTPTCKDLPHQDEDGVCAEVKDLPEQDEDAADEEGVGADRGGHGGDDGGSAVLTHHQTGHVTVHTRHSVLRHTGMRYYHHCNTAPDRARHGKHTSLRSPAHWNALLPPLQHGTRQGASR